MRLCLPSSPSFSFFFFSSRRRHTRSFGDWSSDVCSSDLFDEGLLRLLPEGVDPCGENGEFHTFAWDGPMFGAPIPVFAGAVVERDGFVFADLLPGAPSL